MSNKSNQYIISSNYNRFIAIIEANRRCAAGVDNKNRQLSTEASKKFLALGDRRLSADCGGTLTERPNNKIGPEDASISMLDAAAARPAICVDYALFVIYRQPALA